MNEMVDNNNNNNNIRNEVRLENNLGNSQENNVVEKKSATLDYYKFLFYALKAEVKLYDFFQLLSWTNFIEIFLFVVGIAFFIPMNGARSAFAIINLIHVIRAVIGYCLLSNTPKSHQVLDQIVFTEDEMERENFSDLMRKKLKVLFLDSFENNSTMFISYMFLTFACIIIGCVDFVIALANLKSVDGDRQITAYSRLVISVCLLSKNLHY